MMLVYLLVNSRLLVVTFLGSQKFYVDFQLCGRSVPLTPALFKGHMLLPSLRKACYGKKKTAALHSVLRDRVDLNSDASSLFNSGPMTNSSWTGRGTDYH